MGLFHVKQEPQLPEGVTDGICSKCHKWHDPTMPCDPRGIRGPGLASRLGIAVGGETLRRKLLALNLGSRPIVLILTDVGEFVRG